VATRKVGRREIEVSNEEKLLWPEDGFTKGELIDYYHAIAPAMVAHLKGRPLTIQRFPDGIARGGFYQKDASKHWPEWIHTHRLPKDDGFVDHAICDNAATLVYLANQAALTFHAGTSRVDRIDQPDQLIFDLDPPTDNYATAQHAAGLLSKLLEEIEVPVFSKTTGGKGIHIVVPLRRGNEFDAVHSFARAVAHALERRAPDQLTTQFRKAKRAGRLYLDVGRNGYGHHAVAPYSLRPLSGAPVATPLWPDELLDERVRPRRFTPSHVIDRLRTDGDPWADLRRRSISLGRARSALERLNADD
jgi:bifunctional non-homologous end joining protein LigD